MRLDLGFLRAIALAMTLFGASLRLTPSGLARKFAPGEFFSPARRPATSVLRQIPGYWCNIRASPNIAPVARELWRTQLNSQEETRIFALSLKVQLVTRSLPIPTLTGPYAGILVQYSG